MASMLHSILSYAYYGQRERMNVIFVTAYISLY